METSDIIIAILIIILFFAFMGHVVTLHTNPPVQTTTTTNVLVPVPIPVPSSPNSIVGGCAGTQFGCCPDGKTSKINPLGTNCYN
jgi:hypothetical protein